MTAIAFGGLTVLTAFPATPLRNSNLHQTMLHLVSNMPLGLAGCDTLPYWRGYSTNSHPERQA